VLAKDVRQGLAGPRFCATATNPSAPPPNTPPLVVVPHIDAAADGGGVTKSCVAAMLAKRTVGETGFTSLPRPQQNASPSVPRPHVPWAAETAVSSGTALTRSGTALHGVWMTIGEFG
jgi:hypothetical protein